MNRVCVPPPPLPEPDRPTDPQPEPPVPRRRHALTFEEMEREMWAACGQAALAALLSRPLAEIRHAVPNRPRPWMNLQDMQRALDVLGFRWQASSGPAYDATQDAPGTVGALPNLCAKAWPRCGLVLVQFRGPWEAPHRELRESLRRTHWIAVAPPGHPVGRANQTADLWLTRPAVFDVNLLAMEGLEEQHGWTSREQWENAGAEMVAEEIRGATGSWWVRAGIEIRIAP